jgi:2-hydroxychromene-2-carboxylate isomerase
VSDRLRVYVDFQDPGSFLALEPTRALTREFDLTLEWLPLQVRATASGSASDESGASESVGARHRRVRQAYRQMNHERYALWRGLTLRLPDRDHDTAVAGMGLLWLSARLPEAAHAYLERVFTGFFAGTLALDEPTQIVESLQQCGVDTAEFAAYSGEAGRSALNAVQTQALESGVIAAPCYQIGDEIFVGREHLPMIRWILAGRPGSGDGAEPRLRA